MCAVLFFYYRACVSAGEPKIEVQLVVDKKRRCSKLVQEYQGYFLLSSISFSLERSFERERESSYLPPTAVTKQISTTSREEREERGEQKTTLRDGLVDFLGIGWTLAGLDEGRSDYVAAVAMSWK